ncbi:MAG TPA: hypothetical protein VFF64_05120 [Candidatus Eremiobacteraceae bacterium]|nr:hypothetical protein [Candidatus Eremiobacteraceae bacterium]
MSNTIHSATPATTVVQAATKPTATAPQPAASKPQTAGSDTVQISAAAKALQETIETPAQTAKEAAGGDIQAKRLLAKEAAEHASEK